MQAVHKRLAEVPDDEVTAELEQSQLAIEQLQQLAAVVEQAEGRFADNPETGQC